MKGFSDVPLCLAYIISLQCCTKPDMTCVVLKGAGGAFCAEDNIIAIGSQQVAILVTQVVYITMQQINTFWSQDQLYSMWMINNRLLWITYII